MTSEAQQRLQRGHDMAWDGLKLVFTWARISAMESEYQARTASMRAQINVPPVYKPVVQLLVDSVPEVNDSE